ncbi:MAG: Ppx/GppA family phosphatase [Bifidobacteriaceae bacterium]|jgi:exopolyphosphatase/guanosine-5'-triphosphate,3'-diphosphate pyrophosphatase|nr:Ppx/GppA family phosphatase [Bifidobacteriaceae bacterium]
MAEATGAIRAAGVDCGTNSIRLLIADVAPAAGRLRDVARLMEIVRLGEGVDRTGRFAPEALRRTLAAVARYGERCRAEGVERLRFVATSATRDAANRDVFLDGVRAELGVEAEVIDGLEEARLSFAGALTALPPGLPAPYLCVDLGGGSTELALGGAEPSWAYSMDVGCVRMTERFLRSDPPTPAEVRQAADAVDQVLDAASRHVPLGRAATVIGLAGSITTVTAHALGLERYQPERIDGAVLPLERMLGSCQELWEAARAERARLGFMHPGRVDVIGAGALVWSRVLRRVRRAVEAEGRRLDQVVTSEHDILDGIALSAARAASA